jgi:hypothetical protein
MGLSRVLWCAGAAVQALAGLQAVADAAVVISCTGGSTNGSGAGAQQLPVICLVQGIADLLLVSRHTDRWSVPALSIILSALLHAVSSAAAAVPCEVD